MSDEPLRVPTGAKPDPDNDGWYSWGEFPRGSMGPKVEAAIRFLERGGREVLITTPAALERGIRGETGTRVVPGSDQPNPTVAPALDLAPAR